MSQVKQAVLAYQKVNSATLPPLTAVCQALEAIDESLADTAAYLAQEDDQWRDALLTAQQLLFELMAMTNAASPEGERLLTLYIYANQTLVTASLQADSTRLLEVRLIIRNLHADWLHARNTKNGITHV